ncbi:5-methylcytosine-specific restriction enzyme A [Paenibacillus sp. OK060]|uniref:HNH endonuclease n=1 Tax=Paenibacillus sp. OK060 TaxID=1881034 RepID=UPI00089034B9|nr:HNH endonuclease [Paenibacillus sp. OK060]SDM29267.1 5-methylcytosine-specific restriction enzyme A [Paenibacillus sp. OK060]
MFPYREQHANFKSEFDEGHITFTLSVSKKNYVEAHHLIPMKLQNEYINSIDTESNILSLCPNCHRMVHHARSKDKREILRVFYEKRRSQLDTLGIKFSLSDLYGFYGII